MSLCPAAPQSPPARRTVTPPCGLRCCGSLARCSQASLHGGIGDTLQPVLPMLCRLCCTQPTPALSHTMSWCSVASSVAWTRQANIQRQRQQCSTHATPRSLQTIHYSCTHRNPRARMLCMHNTQTMTKNPQSLQSGRRQLLSGLHEVSRKRVREKGGEPETQQHACSTSADPAQHAQTHAMQPTGASRRVHPPAGRRTQHSTPRRRPLRARNSTQQTSQADAGLTQTCATPSSPCKPHKMFCITRANSPCTRANRSQHSARASPAAARTRRVPAARHPSRPSAGALPPACAAATAAPLSCGGDSVRLRPGRLR